MAEGGAWREEEGIMGFSLLIECNNTGYQVCAILMCIRSVSTSLLTIITPTINTLPQVVSAE